MLSFFEWLVSLVKSIVLLIFEPFFEFIVRAFKYLFSLLGQLWELFKSALWWVLQQLLTLLDNLFIKVSNIIVENFLQFIAWALEKIIPPENVESFSQVIVDIRNILAAFDVFLPIHEILGYTGIVLTAYVTSIVIRVISMIVIRLVVMFI